MSGQKVRKSLRCRLGFHDVWGDTSGVNLGTEAHPVYMLSSKWRCHRCDWVVAK